MENAGVRPQAMSDLLSCSFLGSGKLNIVTLLPTPLMLQVVMSPYPFAYIRPTKGSMVVNMMVMVDSPHSTFTAKQGSASVRRMLD